MRGLAGYLIGALLLAVAGAALLAAARYEGRLADAQQFFATGQLAQSREALDATEGYAAYARWVPGIGARALADVRARRAALDYWERRYDELAATRTDALSGDDAENVELQLVLANAGFRLAQGRATERASAMLALEEAMNGYLAVLRNARWNEEAAYNYEYVARLRDEVAKGRRPPPPPPEEQESAQGQQGAPASQTQMEEFEIYIPLESEERPMPGDAGKSTPNRRRG